MARRHRLPAAGTSIRLPCRFFGFRRRTPGRRRARTLSGTRAPAASRLGGLPDARRSADAPALPNLSGAPDSLYPLFRFFITGGPGFFSDAPGSFPRRPRLFSRRSRSFIPGAPGSSSPTLQTLPAFRLPAGTPLLPICHFRRADSPPPSPPGQLSGLASAPCRSPASAVPPPLPARTPRNLPSLSGRASRARAAGANPPEPSLTEGTRRAPAPPHRRRTPQTGPRRPGISCPASGARDPSIGGINSCR
jgi:hypothetical protein